MKNLKYKIKKIGLVFVLFASGLSACESIVDDMNTDPNNPTDASPDLILTGAQLGNIAVQEGHLARVAGMWSGYFTGVDRQYSDVQVYNVTGAGFNDAWKFVYQGVVEQTKLIIPKAEPTNNKKLQGIAKVVRANALGTATAVWGDIPFSEAADIQNFPNPKFEPQSEVYAKLHLLLDEAIADLESGIGSVGNEDIYFQGDAQKWIEAAYTLKARYYLETKQYEEAAAAAENGIMAPENSLLAPHGDIQGANENFMHTFIARGRAGDLNSSQALLPKLINPENEMYRGNSKTDETARFNYYFTSKNASGEIIPTIPNTSASGIFANSADYSLVTYSENLLTAAEALVRTEKFEEALAKLNEYRAYMDQGGYIGESQIAEVSFNYDPYIHEDFTPGGLLNPGSLTTNEALLKEILLERYITFYGNILGFNDLRRTRKDEVGVQLAPNTGARLPERFLYSNAEINSNINAPNPVPDIYVPTPVNN